MGHLSASMRGIICLAIQCSSLAAAVPSTQVHRLFQREVQTSRLTRVGELQLDLGPQLSKGSQIYFPGSESFVNATSRWNTYGQPNFAVVVEPMNADDVSKIVTYANSINVPFLAVNRGHGNTDTLAKCQNGIEIWMKNFDSIDITPDGQEAQMGGGVYMDQVMEYLYDHGKRSSLGVCGCVGLVGAGLGGGHGRSQGLYGLVSDNVIEFNAVLADGSQINVSATSHPDLYWAMRGAGHNFGIVTNLRYRVYDVPPQGDQWYYALMYFTQDKLEAILNALNTLTASDPPPEMGMILTDFLWNPDVSTIEPVIYVNFNFAGDANAAAPFAQLFKQLSPSLLREGVVPAKDLNTATGTSSSDALCVHGKTELQFAAGLPALNVTTARAMYDVFKAATVAQPLFNGSFVVFETYAQQAFKAVPFDSTAYPHRADNFISTTIIQFDNDQSLNEAGLDLGERLRTLANGGAGGPDHPLTTYVNYAVGSETIETVYGYEEWRQNRLRAIKQAYDPEGRFSFFEPIP